MLGYLLDRCNDPVARPNNFNDFSADRVPRFACLRQSFSSA
jgi:hypothetical protein